MTTTKSSSPPTVTLVATQRAAIDHITTKHALAELAMKLATHRGNRGRKKAPKHALESSTRGTLTATVIELALGAQRGRNTHLSEQGYPACWADHQRAQVGVEELLATPIAIDGGAVTCPKCVKAAGLPTPEETAAFQRAEVEARQPAKATNGEPGAPRAKRQLVLTENLRVRLKIKGLEVVGTLRPDGSMSVQGVDHANPHEAANALAGKLVKYRIDGFQAWRFKDDGGAWRMLRDHRSAQ